MGCVFCRIIAEKDSQKEYLIYKDDICTAFLDQFQYHQGHILIVPNKHYRDVFSLPQTTGAMIFPAAMRLARIVKKEFGYNGLNIYHCSGKCAGQTVFHFHLHIFPRKEGDGLFRLYPANILKNATTLEKSRIKKRISKWMMQKKEAVYKRD